MTYLFDANLLIALVDRHHIHHTPAHRWIDSQPRGFHWATCPIVENAFVRITSNSVYSNPYGSTADAIEALKQNTSNNRHVFWPEVISFRTSSLWAHPPLFALGHLGDLYLLALAIHHGGRLATFDRKIPAHFIRQGSEAICIVEN